MLKKSDFIIVGTAIFRWLENKDEILSYIESKTELPKLKILREIEEAYYSLLAITFTQTKIAGEVPKTKRFTDKDIILLFDQGGGSTEVSYLFPLNSSSTELTSMYHVGTVALEKRFLHQYRSEQFKPSSFKSSIDDSLKRVEEYINGRIDGLNGFEKILPSKKGEISKYNITAFGIGTALKVCFEQYYGELLKRNISGKKFRGWNMKLSQLYETRAKVKTELIDKYVTVERVQKDMPREGHKVAYDLDSKLQMLYGLKTYELLLEKFRIPSISYGYYNLKYGIYLQNYVQGVNRIFNPPKESNSYTDKQEIKTAKQRVTVLDTIRIGLADAGYFHDFALDTLHFIFKNRLANPFKEKKINEGRKRVDIVFDNVDTSGFFWRLNNHYRVLCPKIFVECKNNSDLSNKSFDQLAGRLDTKKGNCGVLVCRNIINIEKTNETQRDFYLRKDMVIIVLDDRDLKTLLLFKEFNHESKIDAFLSEKMDEIIM